MAALAGDEHKSGWTREDIAAVLKSRLDSRRLKKEYITCWPRELREEGLRELGTLTFICAQ